MQHSGSVPRPEKGHCGSDRALQKMEKDYSIRIYNNIFDSFKIFPERKAFSARIIYLKKKTNDNDNISTINKIFNDSEKRALSTLFDTQEDFMNFNKKINILENRSNAQIRKLLLKNKLLTKENENRKEEIDVLLEKLKESETKLKAVNNKLNYEKYILNKTKKSISGKTVLSENKNKK